MKKKVSVGREFDLDADVVSAVTKSRESKVRSVIAICLLVLCSLFVVGATLVGLRDGSFDELQYIWMAAGPLVGAVTVHYFGGSNGKSDTS